MDDPPSPEFPETKMMDMRVDDIDILKPDMDELLVDVDIITSGLKELQAEYKELYATLLEMENADKIVASEAITDVLGITDELTFFDNLNSDFHLYKESLPEGQEASSEGLILYLREENNWSKTDLDFVQNLADEQGA